MTRVLVVDDSRVMRSIIRQALSFGGVEGEQVAEAGDGLEALDAFPSVQPNLILCDVNMPRMNGVEFLKKLEERGELRKVSVVMITSNTNEQVKKNLLHLGAKALIAKPFSVQSLHTRLEPYLAEGTVVEQEVASFETVTSASMPADVSGAIDEAVEEAMEMMAFVGVERLEEFSLPQPPLYIAKIQIDGTCSGNLVVATTREVASDLILTLTGEDSGGENRVLCDGIAEIANIVAGNFLEAYHATDGTRFSAPQTSIAQDIPDYVRASAAYGMDGEQDKLFVGFFETE